MLKFNIPRKFFITGLINIEVTLLHWIFDQLALWIGRTKRAIPDFQEFIFSQLRFWGYHMMGWLFVEKFRVVHLGWNHRDWPRRSNEKSLVLSTPLFPTSSLALRPPSHEAISWTFIPLCLPVKYPDNLSICCFKMIDPKQILQMIYNQSMSITFTFSHP